MSQPTKKGISLRPSLDWLLIFIPISIALRLGIPVSNDVALFVCSGLAIIPLAGWMGRATEHLAEHAGEGVGGLLNATFGNAAELIIALVALSKGLPEIVKASLTGSIIGNILLVLGLSALTGGLKHKEQRFNQTAARAAATSLTLAAIALMVPTVFHSVAKETSGGWTPERSQTLSLLIAIVLLVTYVLSLVFSLRTHKQLFIGESSKGVAQEEDEALHESWTKGKSIGILLVATIFVALISEFLVGAVEKAGPAMGLTHVFIGVIVVAIIGNAAEHSSAILMAMRNKMDLSMAIAVGSSQQIALFVAPVLVLASYYIGPKAMDLEFTIPELVAVVMAVGITGQMAGDGESNWLEGVQLLSVYLVLAVLFYFLPEVHQSVIGAAQAH